MNNNNDELTMEEINELIEAEKNPNSILDFKDILDQVNQNLVFSSHSYRCKVVDKKRKILYDLQVHETPLDTVFSVGLMFEENKRHLVRLDFGPNIRHTNNIGTEQETVIIGSHAHFNSDSGKYSPKNVVPIADLSEFKNLYRIREVVNKFIKYTNIKIGGADDD
ncbi:DUF6978 family protein [Lactobacillus corticis]|uniref:Uncharacterized protein n=1 Tax=Lactobacillus corticis TaxID=2201249 RepID=A0A916QF51_9LACO|nr:hypothetical protein [Lactobacillus corticis]GFZ26141.1 hypothetical protein LCB40_00210 [Lactobacillus corticis]